MNHIDRKAAIAAYKKRESVAGVYVFRAESGRAWVGYANDVDTIGNRLRFSLRTGVSRNRDMQSAWNTEGEAAFTLQFLELLGPDDLGYEPEKALRKRADHWRDTLQAEAA
jgi:hypothetical protein